MTCASCGAALTGPFCAGCGAAVTLIVADRPVSTGTTVLAPPHQRGPSDEFPVRRWRRKIPILVTCAMLLGAAATGAYYGGTYYFDQQRSQSRTPVAARTVVLSGVLVVNGSGLDGCFPGASAANKLDYFHETMNGTTFPCPDGPGGGYSDMSDGASVVVKDNVGKTIAIGALSNGTLDGFSVRFDIEVPDIPLTIPFYEVTIGDRKGQTYPNAKLVADDWRISLSLG